MFSSQFGLFTSAGYWVGFIWLITAIVHIGFAFAVLTDGGTINLQTGRRTALVGAELWALGTLLGGVYVAAVYWLIHHSTLAPPPVSAPPTAPPGYP